MYYLCKNNIAAIESVGFVRKQLKYVNQTTEVCEITNYPECHFALINLLQLKNLQEDIESLFALEEYPHCSKNSFYETVTNANQIQILCKNLSLKINAIIDFCEEFGFEELPNGFDVKLPPVKTLDEFNKVIKSLDSFLHQCPYLNSDDNKIELKKTDNGSIWFEFAIMGASVTTLLRNLGKIVEKALKIKSQITSNKQQEVLLKNANTKAEVLEAVANTHKQIIEEVTRICVEELQEEINPLSENEDKERLKYCLNTLSDLMTKGLEIYSSVDALPEVKKLFPACEIDKEYLPDVKQIESKTGDKNT